MVEELERTHWYFLKSVLSDFAAFLISWNLISLDRTQVSFNFETKKLGIILKINNKSIHLAYHSKAAVMEVMQYTGKRKQAGNGPSRRHI